MNNVIKGIANRSGNTLEKTVSAVLASKGFQEVLYNHWLKKPEHYSQELLLRNVPYSTIYGHKGTTEFLLKSKQYGLETRIECKWQQSAGSVDEKFPYLYLNCVLQVPEEHMLIILDGNGAKEGAVNWLKQACHNQFLATPKKIEVMCLTEFMGWANTLFR